MRHDPSRQYDAQPVDQEKDWRPNIEVRPLFRPTTSISATWPITGTSPKLTLASIYKPTPEFKLTEPKEATGTYTLEPAKPTGVLTFTRPVTA